jgi:hypothetical protein
MSVGLEILKAVRFKTMVFWCVISCKLVDTNLLYLVFTNIYTRGDKSLVSMYQTT